MASRLNLQATLKTVIGNNNVYFQPPESISLKYPCIIYSLSDVQSTKANDKKYKFARNYQITLICKDPDNSYIDAILALPYTDMDRTFTADNLYHYVFTHYEI